MLKDLDKELKLANDTKSKFKEVLTNLLTKDDFECLDKDNTKYKLSHSDSFSVNVVFTDNSLIVKIKYYRDEVSSSNIINSNSINVNRTYYYSEDANVVMSDIRELVIQRYRDYLIEGS